jgi:dolichyldiphosphatase
MKSFDLTCLYYEEADIFGIPMVLLSLLPIFLVVSYVTLITVNHDLNVVWMLAGQLFNEGLNNILKRIIKQPRPSSSKKAGFGMPSSHSQFMWYFAIYGLLCLSISRQNYWLRVFYALIMIGAATGVSVSRVWLGYHNFDQVVVGASVGSLTGIFWFYTIAFFSKSLKEKSA